MQPIPLHAHIQPMIWGGRKLADFGFSLPDDAQIGEAWTLSVHPAGQSMAQLPSGELIPLAQLWQQQPALFGIDPEADFPLMVKWIDAQDDLSVQVHPGDQAAQAVGLANGKTECWYIVAAEPNAAIIFGHTAADAATLAAAIEQATLPSYLTKVPVKAGDFFYVPAGTVHALTKGCVVLEVQQNSNTTYRLYDYDRLDRVTGLPRELHIKEGLAAIDYPHREWHEWTDNHTSTVTSLTRNAFFFVERWQLTEAPQTLSVGAAFQVLTVVQGSLVINGVTYDVGSTLLLPAQQQFSLSGSGLVLRAGIPEGTKSEVRIGVDLGGTQLRIAAVDQQGQLVKQVKMVTCAEQGPDFVINNLIRSCQALQQEFTVLSLGVAVPGPLNAKLGIIQSPPNLPGWDNIALKDQLAAALQLPVAIENVANAAALGEALLGAGKGHESVFYVTVSTGIGGGFVYRNELIGGAHDCAGEIGNLIISDQGQGHEMLNTGALEVLASDTALGQQARAQGLANAAAYLRQPAARAAFVEHLAAGLANIIHTVDPDIIVLGGGVMNSAELFWDELLTAVEQKVYPQLRGQLRFELAALAGNAGVLGAAQLKA